MINILTISYFTFVFTTSLITFVLYGFDKRWAKSGKRRVPEQTLHVLALLGGWPGALLGQRRFRHKTQKLSFQIVFWLTTIAHLALVSGVVWLRIQGRI